MRRTLEAQKIREKRNTRKKSRVWGMNTKLFLMGLCTIVCLLLYGVLWISGVWQSSLEVVEGHYGTWMGKMGFVVEDILLEGRQRIEKEEVLNALKIKYGEPILKFDPWKAKQRLERNSWVRSCLVERRFPNTIYIRLSERHPIARWQHNQTVDLIDEQGQVMKVQKESPKIPQEFSKLPLFVGSKAQEKGSEFLKMLTEFPSILKHVTASSLVSDRRWNVYLDKTIEVCLPEENMRGALEVLTQLEKQDLVFAREISRIDLRFLPKIIIRPKADISSLTSENSNLGGRADVLKKSKDV